MPEGSDQHFSGCFATTVRIHRQQSIAFTEAIQSWLGGPIYLAGGHQDELLHPTCLGAIQEDLRAHDVGCCKQSRIFEASVDIRLSGKVNNGVDIVLAKTADDIVSGRNVAFVKGEIRTGAQYFSVFQGSAVLELVEGDEIVIIWIGDCEGSKDPGTSTAILSVLALPE